MSRTRVVGTRKLSVLSLESLEARANPSASPLVIAGSVFNDTNANGLRDRGEEGISATALQLVTRQGVIVGNATTDDAGAFVFDRDARVTGTTAVVSYSGSFTQISSSPDQVVALPRFDPELGTLTGIEIEVNAQLDVVASLENLERNSTVLRVSQENSIRVTGPGDAIVASAPAQTFTAALGGFDGNTDFSGSSGIRFPRRSSSVNTLVSIPDASGGDPGATDPGAGTDPGASDPAAGDPSAATTGATATSATSGAVPEEFQSYVGNGSVAFQASIVGRATSQGPGNYQFAVVSTGSATITIRYTYQPSDALRPGDYIVRELTQPDGYLDGRDSVDGKTVIPNSWLTDEISVTLGTTSFTKLGFGEVKAVSLAGSSFIDGNGDGAFDPDEAGAEGAIVSLEGVDDTGARVTRQAEIAADAVFSFGGLRPGNYKVASSLLPKYMAGPGVPGDQGGVSGPASVSSISLASGTDATGYLLPQIESAALTGVVYLDRNSNGVRDEGEPGIANQTVTISGTAGGRDVNLSAVTNADGEYTFAELIPGAYTITSPATSGYTATGTEAGSLGGTPGTDSISDITIAPGDLGDGYLLGRSAQLTVSGRVFLDRNANGAVDSVDTLLSGIRVTLTGTASTGESITRQATTNARGAYAFPRLPDGVYRISAQTATGTFAARAIVGTSGGSAGVSSVAGIDLGPSGNAVGYDFPMMPPSRISGTVFQDRNRNGARNQGEYGLGGVLVTLTGNDDLGRVVRRTTVTAADGSYNFGNLRSGSYFVSRSVPAGYQAGVAKVGSLGGMVHNGGIGVSLGFGNVALRYDFAVVQAVSGGLSKRLYIA